MMDGSRIDIWHVRIVWRGLVTTATTTVVLVTLGTTSYWSRDPDYDPRL